MAKNGVYEGKEIMKITVMMKDGVHKELHATAMQRGVTDGVACDGRDKKKKV